MNNILLTGASGYVGGKLLKRLEFDGYKVRGLSRNPKTIRASGQHTEIIQGDMQDPNTLPMAFKNVDTAFYLIHSLADQKDFEKHEIEAANNFANAAREAGVSRIIYLGGLGHHDDSLSPHLRSRQDVGRILRESGITTIEFRASIVLGAGSLSFEMIRALTEHLPFMIMPRWVSTKAQPIGIYDLIEYLVQAINIELTQSRVVEIGGADQLSYRDLMTEYAKQKNLKRMMIPVPVLTPWLSSHWLGLVTPLYAAVGRKLIESIRNPTVVEHPESQFLFDVPATPAAEAIREAIFESEYSPQMKDEIPQHTYPTSHVLKSKVA